MANPDTSSTAVAPSEWYDRLATLMRGEIGKGRMVRVMLPGAGQPFIVEGAYGWARMLIVEDAAGRTYHVADPAGVVVITEPVELPPPGSKPYWMTVDEPDAKQA